MKNLYWLVIDVGGAEFGVEIQADNESEAINEAKKRYGRYDFKIKSIKKEIVR